MKDKFKNKDGSLTRYSFACGYMEQVECGDKRLQLYQDCLYHVRAVVYGDPQWETFETLTEARAFYRKLKAELFPRGAV